MARWGAWWLLVMRVLSPGTQTHKGATTMIFAAFALVALLAAGLFAINTSDSTAYCVALVALVVVVLVVAPHVPALMAYVQHAIDAKMPIALR
jgi:hypothetical protein